MDLNAEFNKFKSGDGELDQPSLSDKSTNKKSNKQVELDFLLGPIEKGPSAAKKFNELIAKTLKLQE